MEQLMEQLTQAVVNRISIEMEASGRHVHLCRQDVETLFGPGAQLEPVRPLSQPGQFVCSQRVTVVGPKGSLSNVVVLGPERKESQVEISLTDGVALGITPPVRQSGKVEDTPGVTLRNGDRQVTLSHGLIAAQRHIHLTPDTAAQRGLHDGQVVRLRTLTRRPVLFEDVVVRVSEQSAPAVHIDYDEANACGFRKGDRSVVVG